MRVEVESLRSVERGRASRLLSRAFAADPIITHYLYGKFRRRFAYPAFFRAALEEMVPSGHVYAAHENGTLIGVAAWLPPNAAELDLPTRQAAARQRRVVSLMFPRASRKLFAGFAALEHYHPSEPHWYLAFVGIEPTIQGRGIGQTLLTPVLKIADQRSTLCYLETPFPRTHAFYERLGFARRAALRPFVGAQHDVVTFLRSPRA